MLTMESASDHRRRLVRERLQRCHLADLKLFFPLAFSHSRSPAYVRTCITLLALLQVLVTMQIFVVVLVVVVFVVLYPATGFSQPTIRVCLFCFCLQCHVFSIALHIVARGSPAHAYT